MSKEDIIRKLTSRKFWLAVAAFVTELIVVFRGDAEQSETVSAIIMAGATVIAYIVGEGLIDAGNTPAGGDTSSAPVCALVHLPHEGKADAEGFRCE